MNNAGVAPRDRPSRAPYRNAYRVLRYVHVDDDHNISAAWSNIWFALHLRRRNAPVLTVVSQAPLPGAVIRPLVSPTAVYPWHMVWRRDIPKPGLRALNQAIDEMAATEHWLELPEDAWLPEPEASSIRRPPEAAGPRIP
jgi:hypothetical protein